MLQDNCMFTCVHLMQEEDWHLVKEVIAIHTNSFSKQQEYKGMISFNKRIIITSLLCQLNTEDLTGGIIKKEDQIKDNNSTPLINDLKMSDIFKDKDNEKGNGVMDELLDEVSQLLVLVGLAARQIRDVVTGQVQVSHK